MPQSGNVSLDLLTPVVHGRVVERGLQLRVFLLGAEGRVAAALSEPFDVYAAQVPYSLRFEAQPSQFVMGGSTFDRMPRVEVRDVAGAKIGDAALQVHLALERITPPPDPDAPSRLQSLFRDRL